MPTLSEGQGQAGFGAGDGILETCQMFSSINVWESQTDGVIYSSFGCFTK